MSSIKDGVLISDGKSVNHLTLQQVQMFSDAEYARNRREINVSPFVAINRTVTHLLSSLSMSKPEEAYQLVVESAARFGDIKR